MKYTLTENSYLKQSGEYEGTATFEFVIKELKTHITAVETENRIVLRIGQDVMELDNSLQVSEKIEDYLKDIHKRISNLMPTAPKKKTRKKSK